MLDGNVSQSAFKCDEYSLKMKWAMRRGCFRSEHQLIRQIDPDVGLRWCKCERCRYLFNQPTFEGCIFNELRKPLAAY